MNKWTVDVNGHPVGDRIAKKDNLFVKSSPGGFGGTWLPHCGKKKDLPCQFIAVNTTTSVDSMNEVFLIRQGVWSVWYSPLRLVSSSSRSYENVMQVVPSKGGIRFTPVQIDFSDEFKILAHHNSYVPLQSPSAYIEKTSRMAHFAK